MASPIPANVDSDATSQHYVSYSGAVVDTDLVAEGNGPCRRIRCNAAGSLVVKRASDNTNVTLQFLAGETQSAAANALVASGSTAAGVTVYF